MKQFLEGFQLLNREELLEVNGGYSSSAYGGSGSSSWSSAYSGSGSTSGSSRYGVTASSGPTTQPTYGEPGSFPPTPNPANPYPQAGDGKPTQPVGLESWRDRDEWEIGFEFDSAGGALYIDNRDTETIAMALNDSLGMAKMLKTEFKSRFGRDIAISDASLANEIRVHADWYRNGCFTGSTEETYAGEQSKDGIRWVWDAMVGWQ